MSRQKCLHVCCPLVIVHAGAQSNWVDREKLRKPLPRGHGQLQCSCRHPVRFPAETQPPWNNVVRGWSGFKMSPTADVMKRPNPMKTKIYCSNVQSKVKSHCAAISKTDRIGAGGRLTHRAADTDASITHLRTPHEKICR